MPKLAVIADVHANYAALEAVLASIRTLSVDGVIFLGDYLTDCPYPERTLRLIRGVMTEYPVWLVRGNREDYLIAHRKYGRPDDWRKGGGSGSLLYTYESLTEEDLDFLEKLPATTEVRLPDAPPIFCCHASPSATKEWLADKPEKMRAALESIPGNLILCGHTHRPASYSFPEGRVLICPSCGLPQGPGGNFMVLTLKHGRWVERILQADYDLEAFIRDYEASPMPEYAPIWSLSVIRMLRERSSWTAQCVSLTYRLAKRDRYARPIETYWEEAAKKLKLVP